MFFMKPGMSMPTGQPSTQVGVGQSRQRVASVTACSRLRPLFTSILLVTRTSGASVGIWVRGMAVRSLAVIAARSSSRHSASRPCVVFAILLIFAGRRPSFALSFRQNLPDGHQIRVRRRTRIASCLPHSPCRLRTYPFRPPLWC